MPYLENREGVAMSHLSQNKTHRNPQNLVACRIAKEPHLRASSAPRDLTGLRAEERLRRLAATDPLTGLANYRKLSDRVESEIRRSERTTRAFAVLLFNVDKMKQINDRHGHQAGNWALCRLADILRSSCRSIDTAARYGADKFAVVLPETDTQEADAVGRRICERLSNDREEPRLSVSVGIAVYPEDGITNESLFQAAGRGLHEMKHTRGIF
jgi:diguanylate cyclase (GGDEF)-like protein